jgi:uncharacterized protein
MQPKASEQHSAKKVIPWRYLTRLAACFLISFPLVLYLVFAPMVNRGFYNVCVLFKPVPCSEYNRFCYGRPATEVSFTNNAGACLRALYLPSTAATHVILMHHGQCGNINSHLPLSSFLLQPENSVFIYDYSGFGKSEGSPNIKGMMDDARAAYKCLVQKLGIDPKRIVNFGGSLGTGPAALVAAEQPCAGLVLLSPYSSLKSAAKETFSFLNIYPDFLLTDSDFDTPTNVSRLNKPVLICHGADDPLIRIHHGDEVYAAAHDPKTYLRTSTGGHFVIGSDEIKYKVLQFIRELE